MSATRSVQGPQPLVTIYIPTRDRAALVERAVRSALAQQGPSIEVIVVDDGSSDDTVARLQNIAAHDCRLRVLRQATSQGACAARNRAIAEAQGRFCAGLDDDDEFAPDHLARLLAHHDERFSLVASSLIEVRPNKRVPITHEAGIVTLDQLLYYNRMGIQALVLTERLRTVGGFDETLPALQDYDLWVRMVARYGSALKTSDATYLAYVDHVHTRISAVSQNRLQALALFSAKHAALMTPAHAKTMELHALKYRGQSLRASEALRLACPGNAKMVMSMLVNAHVPALQRIYHRFRATLTAR